MIARLDLWALRDLVKVLSGNVETVAECERVRAEFGDDPQKWLPPFCGWKVGTRGQADAA